MTHASDGRDTLDKEVIGKPADNQSLRAPRLDWTRDNPWGGASLASGFFLDGGMIPRSGRRSIDERLEERLAAESSTAVMDFRGRNHVVRLINLSTSGAMVIFPYVPNIGEKLRLQLLDRGLVSAQVMWVKDGRIGLSFPAAAA
jgi:hypothetical protein